VDRQAERSYTPQHPGIKYRVERRSGIEKICKRRPRQVIVSSIILPASDKSPHNIY